MKKLYILNAVSLNMLPPTVTGGHIGFARVENPRKFFASLRELQGGDGVEVVPAIGHADTATVVGGILGVPCPANRVTVVLEPGDVGVVAQYSGPRLPEGATELPEGAAIAFYVVWVEADPRVEATDGGDAP